MILKKLKPILNKNELAPGARYIEVGVDAFNRLYLEESFRVIGHPFMRKLIYDKVSVVRTSYRHDPFSTCNKQLIQFLGDCGVDIRDVDNQHRLFQYSPQTRAVLRRIVRRQNRKAYERLTGVHIEG